MELEPGFKLSEAGQIPEDWDARPISSFGRVLGGKRLPPGFALQAQPNGFPYIRVSDFQNGSVNVGTVLFVPQAAAAAISRYIIKSSDIYISVAGTVGLVGTVPETLSGANLTENADRITDLVADRDYVVHCLNATAIQQALRATTTVGAQPKLAIQTIDAVKVPLPPTIEEQAAISRCLNDINAWIAEAEAEAAKLASVKAAAINALLTPITRLPGFTGEWERVRLGDLYDPLSTVAVARAAYVSGQAVACVHYGDIHVRYDEFVRMGLDHVATVPTKLVRAASRLKSGDVLIADAAEDLEGVGKAVELVAPEPSEVVGGLHVQALRPKSDRIALGFAGYLFRQNTYREAVERAASGLKVFGISKSQLAALEIFVPPTLDEQQAIAAVLSDLDVALAAARAVVAKAREVKAAAMDTLLSGRMRLPPFDRAARRTPSDAKEAA
ncbi:type I restriction enzyme, S subunit [Methylorubrum extorquens]